MAAVSRRAAWLGAGSVALSLASAAAPGSVHACSGFACFPGTFYLEPEAVLPANTVALRWAPGWNANSDNPVAPVPHVTRIDGTAEEQLIEIADLEPNGDKLVRILKGFVPGGRYRLWVEGDEDCLQFPVEIVAGPEAPLPTQLGRTLVADPSHGDVTVPTASGSCDTPIPAVAVDVDLELAAATKPWAALLMYTVRVDAKPWSYVPSYGLWPALSDAGVVVPDDASTTVFAQCPGAPANGLPLDPNAESGDLETGTHQIVIEASLPDVVTVLYTDPVEITLECAPAAEPDSGTLDGGDDAGTATESSAHDDESEDDQGESVAVAADAGSDAHHEPSKGDDTSRTSAAVGNSSNAGGCAVYSAGTSTGTGTGRGAAASLGWLLCALTLLPLRARSRRRTTG